MDQLQTIKGKNFVGKKVFLRADLNLPVSNHQVSDTTRIKRLLPTINYLLERGASIILASHFGRPDGHFIAEMSLRHILPTLETNIGQKIAFIADCIGNEVISRVKKLNRGEILLLENLRFYKEEEQNDKGFAQSLAKLADVYVNDAFACSHREHASIVGITEFLPSFAGCLIEEEITSLDLVINTKEKPVIAIVGGKKVSTKFKLLSYLADKVDNLIIAGAMANTFAYADGKEVGKSFVELEFVDEVKKFVTIKHKAQIFMPDDFTVLNAESNEVELHNIDNLNSNSIIYDLGTKSVIDICRLLDNSKVVLWNGPLGFFEDNRFAAATSFIARHIAKLTSERKIKSVVGGGDVVAAIERVGVGASISYISTAGGAFLEYLESGDLPGIKVLRKKI